MERKLLTVAELSHELNVSRSWIYQQVERDGIPHIRLGRAVRFQMHTIQDWLVERKTINAETAKSL